MKYSYINKTTGGEFYLYQKEKNLDRKYFTRDINTRQNTIVRNKGKDQKVYIDEQEYLLEKNTFLPLMLNQSFHFEKPEDLVAWQFNREFYCIVTHDEEVSCVGFLFYGTSQTMFVKPDKLMLERFEDLTQVFIEEFKSVDNIQEDMLRMLLVRLIIKLTRIAKEQYLGKIVADDKQFNIFRQFNLLVERNFRNEHQVKFYANALTKSPKTLSNLFSIYNQKSPSDIIYSRIIVEAKRLLLYTDKSVKEISFELGFKDMAHFCRFFKSQTKKNPSEFKTEKELS